MLSQMTIKAKLILIVGLNALFFVVASGYAIQQMDSIGTEIEGIAERDLPLIDIVSKITVHQLEMEVMFERAGRYGALMTRDAEMQANFEKSVSEFKHLSDQVKEEILQGEALAEMAQQQAHLEAEKQEFKKIFDGLKSVELKMVEFDQQASEVFVGFTAGGGHLLESKVQQAEHVADGIASALGTMLVEIEHFTSQAALKAEEHEKSALTVLLWMVVVAIVLSAVIATVMIRDIRRCLDGGLVAMDRMAAGDLSVSVDVKGGDEICDMLRGLEKMRLQLVEVMDEIDRSSATMASASEELAAASEESSRSVDQQRQETEQLAAAMNEMAATVQEVATSTASASDSANQAQSEAERGRRVVSETISSINTLADDVERSSEAIAKLGQESDNIGMVLEVIRGIAEQTNLLALNAAIEAARAGEQGRGFAVVADEVRVLATRTNDSTQEIQSMIERLQSGARESVAMMDESRKQMNESMSKATEAGDVLEVVKGAVASISEMNAHIATAAEQQSQVTEDLNQNISVIAEASEQNACTSNQTAQASTELAETAVGLKGMIEQFKLA